MILWLVDHEILLRDGTNPDGWNYRFFPRLEKNVRGEYGKKDSQTYSLNRGVNP